jgi:hypothetical protein
MVDASLSVGFWHAVADCLVEFHQVPRVTADELVKDLLRRLSAATETVELSRFRDMIYHEEPWYIACNLAGESLPLERFWQPYRTIVVRNGLTAGIRHIDYLPSRIFEPS